MPWLSTSPASARRRSPPTRIGAPIAVDGACGCRRRISCVAERVAAVEFSGQTTKSGRWRVPASTSAARSQVSVHVAAGDLTVVGEHVVAVAGHVALDDRDRAVPASALGRRRPGRAPARPRPRPAPPATSASRRSGAPTGAEPERQPGEHGRGQRDQQADAVGAHPGSQPATACRWSRRPAGPRACRSSARRR